VNYTIQADAGLGYVNVEKHNSDVELRVLPLQWALDSAIISLQTGKSYVTPQELPYTQETNAEQTKKIRLGYLNGIRDLFVLVL
jgi:ATP-binding cassette, subfamily A (ABC1), member 3